MADAANFTTTYRSEAVDDQRPVGRIVKRLADIALAGVGILLLSPLLLLCFAACRLCSPGPVLFGHQRVGFQGNSFKCLKFRTMVVDGDKRLAEYLAANPQAKAEWESSRKLRFDPRVTAIGAILRKSSLDELPQLFNVLKGEMSIVGPRPVTEIELSRYASSVRNYLACRPGITGLWQVSGRSGTSYRKRVAFDSCYARNWSFWLDVKIIVATVPALLDSDNAY